MQIMPGGGAWTNPAALSQQVLGDAKHAAGNKQQSHVADPVTPLEQTGETGDRDAQERYAGPQHGQASQANDQSKGANADSMLVLPADDEQGPSTLDLLG